MAELTIYFGKSGAGGGGGILAPLLSTAVVVAECCPFVFHIYGMGGRRE